jgi:hypothetical protein
MQEGRFAAQREQAPSPQDYRNTGTWLWCEVSTLKIGWSFIGHATKVAHGL